MSQSLCYNLYYVTVLVLKFVLCHSPCVTICIMSQSLCYNLYYVTVLVLQFVLCHSPCVTICIMSQSFGYNLYYVTVLVLQFVLCHSPCVTICIMSQCYNLYIIRNNQLREAIHCNLLSVLIRYFKMFSDLGICHVMSLYHNLFQISTMPGLPTRPAFYNIDVDTDTGDITGLF